MLRQLFAILFIITSGQAAAIESVTQVDQWLVANHCTACHPGGNAPKPVLDCNSCHVRMGVQLYQRAPKLTFFELTDGRVAPIYSEEGLTTFLRNPVRRNHSGLGVMSPLTEDRIQSLMTLLRGKSLLAPSPTKQDHDLESNKSVKHSKLLRKNLLLGTRLYQRIIDEGFAKSCRHCHSKSEHANEELLSVFGRAPKLFFLQLDEKVVTIADESRPALNPGPGCSDSLLVQHLEERRKEEGGWGTALTGMPMSVDALPADLISDIRLWSSQGCPSPKGFLCSPCGS